MFVSKSMIVITGKVYQIIKVPKISYIWIICKNRKGIEIKLNCKVFGKDIKLLDKIKENNTYSFIGDVQFNSEQQFENKKGFQSWNKDIILYDILKNEKDNQKTKKKSVNNEEAVDDWLSHMEKKEESEVIEKVPKIKKNNVIKKGKQSAKDFAKDL